MRFSRKRNAGSSYISHSISILCTLCKWGLQFNCTVSVVVNGCLDEQNQLHLCNKSYPGTYSHLRCNLGRQNYPCLHQCMLFNIKVLFSMSITKDVHKWLVLQRFFLARKLQSSVLYVGKSSLLLATKAEVEGF